MHDLYMIHAYVESKNGLTVSPSVVSLLLETFDRLIGVMNQLLGRHTDFPNDGFCPRIYCQDSYTESGKSPRSTMH